MSSINPNSYPHSEWPLRVLVIRDRLPESANETNIWIQNRYVEPTVRLELTTC